MMKFDIITDSCCDFTDAQYADMNVTSVPLSVRWNGTCRDHFSDESALRDFYEGMRRGVALTTSALNPDQWARVMEPRLQAGRDLLVLAVSSGVSTTYQSAMIAAEELREKYPQRLLRVVDSRSGSLGEGLLLWHACRLRDAGETLAAAGHWLEEHCSRICHWVTVNELVHLKRSGRLSSAGALIGTMLDIKPIIKVTAVLGMIFSVIFMILQLIPIPGLSGVHFGKESYFMLLVWIAIGAVFYLTKKKTITKV